MNRMKLNLTSYQRRLSHWEPFLPLVLTIHGSVILSHLDAGLWQWLVMGSLLLGLFSLPDWGRSVQAVLFRAGYILAAGWLLMLMPQGVNFYFQWYFVVVALYPLLLTSPPALFLVGLACAAYLVLPVFVEVPSIGVIIARTFLLAFVGWTTWTIGSTAVRHAREREQREQDLRKANQDLEEALVKLETSETQLRLAIEAANIGLWAWTTGTDHVRYSPEWKRQLGYAEDELADDFREWQSRVHPDDLARITALLQAYLQKPWPNYESEFRLRHKDGAYRWILARASLLVDGPSQPPQMFGAHLDITKRKEAEQALRESEENSRRYAQRLQILHQIDLSILSADSSAEIAGAALKHLKKLIPCRRASIGLYDFEANEVQVLAAVVNGEPFIPAASRLPLQGLEISLEQLRQGQLVVVENLAALVDPPPLLQRLAAEDIRSQVAVPLRTSEQLIGSLNLSFSEASTLTPEQEQIAVEVADQLAIAIQQARLKEQLARHAAELEQRVAERTAELREQYHQQAVNEERQRLARDLHDAVSQTLFSAALIAEALPRLWSRYPDKAQQSLLDLQRLNRGALSEMRNLLLELRPAALIDAKLEELLRQLAEALAGRTAVEVSLQVEGQAMLPPDPKIAFYRISQEAMNNITKHARATQVLISLHNRPEQTQLTIKDNGRGFDPALISTGRLGLGIMQERAETVGASLEIISQPGQGASIIVSWPDGLSNLLPSGNISPNKDFNKE